MIEENGKIIQALQTISPKNFMESSSLISLPNFEKTDPLKSEASFRMALQKGSFATFQNGSLIPNHDYQSFLDFGQIFLAYLNLIKWLNAYSQSQSIKNNSILNADTKILGDDVSELIQRCLIIKKDHKGYGLTVSGDNPVYVQSVRKDGAADRAGVREGDRIIKVNGNLVTQANHLEVVRLIKAASYVALTVLSHSPSILKSHIFPESNNDKLYLNKKPIANLSLIPSSSFSSPLDPNAKFKKFTPNEFRNSVNINNQNTTGSFVSHIPTPPALRSVNQQDIDKESMDLKRQSIYEKILTLKKLFNQEALILRNLQKQYLYNPSYKLKQEINSVTHRLSSLNENINNLTKMAAYIDMNPVPLMNHIMATSSSYDDGDVIDIRNPPSITTSRKEYVTESSDQNSATTLHRRSTGSVSSLLDTTMYEKNNAEFTPYVYSSSPLNSFQSPINGMGSLTVLNNLYQTSEGAINEAQDTGNYTSNHIYEPIRHNIEEKSSQPFSIPPFNRSACILNEVSKNQILKHAFSLEDDGNTSDSEKFENYGPFNDIHSLKNHPAHLAIFLNYLFCNSDPNSLLFYLITDYYMHFGNLKDMKRWAYEIHSSFVVPKAPLKIAVPESSIISIDDALQNSLDKEEIMKFIFRSARKHVLIDIREKLADFRLKRTLGLSSIYGDNAALDETLDKNKISKIAEHIMTSIVEKLIKYWKEDPSSLETVTDKNSLLLSAFLTVCRFMGGFCKSFNSSSISANPLNLTAPNSSSLISFFAIQDRIPSFCGKEKSQARFKFASKKSKALSTMGHSFLPHHYMSLTFCNRCHDIVRGIGFQGLQCQSCQYNTHKPCLDSIEEYCVGIHLKPFSNVSSSTPQQNYHSSLIPPSLNSINHNFSQISSPAISSSSASITNAVSGSNKPTQVPNASSGSFVSNIMRRRETKSMFMPSPPTAHLNIMTEAINEDSLEEEPIIPTSSSNSRKSISGIKLPKTNGPDIVNDSSIHTNDAADKTSRKAHKSPLKQSSSVLRNNFLSGNHQNQNLPQSNSFSTGNNEKATFFLSRTSNSIIPNFSNRWFSDSNKHRNEPSNSIDSCDNKMPGSDKSSTNTASTTTVAHVGRSESMKAKGENKYPRKKSDTTNVPRSKSDIAQKAASSEQVTEIDLPKPVLVKSSKRSFDFTSSFNSKPQSDNALISNGTASNQLSILANNQSATTNNSSSSLLKYMELLNLNFDDPDLDTEPGIPNWQKSVDWEHLKKMKPKEVKRQDVISELFHTEKNHVRNLKVLDYIFYRPMKLENLVSEELLDRLFPNLDELLRIHGELNQKMKMKKSENVIIDSIGPMLLDFFDGVSGLEFQTACARFCENQTLALEALKLKQRKESKLMSFLCEAESNPLCRRLQLKDLVPCEMQRLTKYPLLIENVMKYTAISETDEKGETIEYKDLAVSYERARSILAHVNESVREAENYQRLIEVESRLDKSALERAYEKVHDNPKLQELKNLKLTSKRLIMEGNLQWKCSRTKTVEIYALLLEDLLLITQKQDERYILKFQSTNVTPAKEESKLSHSPVIKLNNLLTKNVATDKRAFFLVSTVSEGPQLYELIASTSNERKQWLLNIEKTIEKLKGIKTSASIPKCNLSSITTSAGASRHSSDPTSGAKEAEKSSKQPPNIKNGSLEALNIDLPPDLLTPELPPQTPEEDHPKSQQEEDMEEEEEQELVEYVATPQLVRPCEVVVRDPLPSCRAHPILSLYEQLRRADLALNSALANKRDIVSRVLSFHASAHPKIDGKNIFQAKSNILTPSDITHQSSDLLHSEESTDDHLTWKTFSEQEVRMGDDEGIILARALDKAKELRDRLKMFENVEKIQHMDSTTSLDDRSERGFLKNDEAGIEKADAKGLKNDQEWPFVHKALGLMEIKDDLFIISTSLNFELTRLMHFFCKRGAFDSSTTSKNCTDFFSIDGTSDDDAYKNYQYNKPENTGEPLIIQRSEIIKAQPLSLVKNDAPNHPHLDSLHDDDEVGKDYSEDIHIEILRETNAPDLVPDSSKDYLTDGLESEEHQLIDHCIKHVETTLESIDEVTNSSSLIYFEYRTVNDNEKVPLILEAAGSKCLKNNNFDEKAILSLVEKT
ncbi:uncharacterized protein LOC135929908 isoform X2 [Gordionus sp. m RMFG-2023]|uniref:uncharacterized protein LOC135929908 isoform X2 n=1 Tax=Gordionus sp. m RMFG-2023 TaxID=3053472 RepID=UPI0031FBE7FD